MFTRTVTACLASSYQQVHSQFFPQTRPVRLAYQPPASSTFISEQTSNQPAVLFSQNKPAISHQPNEQADDLQQGFEVIEIIYHVKPQNFETMRKDRNDDFVKI
jgi:hypothetical protein